MTTKERNLLGQTLIELGYAWDDVRLINQIPSADLAIILRVRQVKTLGDLVELIAN